MSSDSDKGAEDPKGTAGKIRPRLSRTPEEEAEDAAEAEEKKRKLLKKRSDPAWLSKLARIQPKSQGLAEEPTDATPDGPTGAIPETTKKPAAETGTPDSADEDWPEEHGADKPTKLPEDPESEDDDEEEDSDAGDADTTTGERSGKTRRRRRSKKKPKPKKWFERHAGWIILLVLFSVLAGLAGLRFGELLGFKAGREAAANEASAEEVSKVKELPDAARQRADEALLAIREGNAAQGEEELARLIEEFPDVPSLHYAAGLAAVQRGDIDSAERYAHASIQRGERVSDSYVLLSVVESQRGAETTTPMGDPKLRTKAMLELAIAADPLNAGARMELASLLRYMGDGEGALRELRATKARLHPVDSHLSVDVTVALIEVEMLPTNMLEAADPGGEDPRALLPAAFAAMRKDDFDLACQLLRRCQAVLPADTFLYLVNDRAFRRFAYRDDVREFLGD